MEEDVVLVMPHVLPVMEERTLTAFLVHQEKYSMFLNARTPAQATSLIMEEHALTVMLHA